MAPTKRSAPATDAQDDASSGPSSPETNDSQASSGRKRRRISDDSNTTPEATPTTRNADRSSQLSDSDSEDEVETEAATQAMKEKRARQREKGNIANDSGVLKKVEVTNFMCHGHFEFKLIPLINFICGANGSGKSAILTAIILCLGGKASVTNRGGSLKSFIKEGAEQARIQCWIENRGEGAYMPEEYGDSIEVERHFSRAGTSGYKIKTQSGRIVSTKRGDLENIVDHFCLQIDNPLNVLSQDMARAFIGAIHPNEKYKFFVKGVQLEQLDQDYTLLGEQLESMRLKLEIKEQDVNLLESYMDDAKRRKEEARKKSGLRDRMHELRRQIAWVQIRDQEKLLQEYATEVAEADAKIATHEQKFQDLSNRCDQADQANDRVVQARNDAETALNAQKDEFRERNALLQEAVKEVTNAHTDTRKVREDLKSRTELISQKKKEIAAEEARLNEINGGGAARRLQQLEEAQRLATAAREDWEAHKANRQRLADTITDAEKVVQENQRVKNDKEKDKLTQAEKLRDARDNKDQAWRAFKPNTEKLIAAIAKEARFEHKPIGPIGNYVRLQRPEWSSILERMFGGTLSSFLCFSKKDANILADLKRRVRCDADILTGNTMPIKPLEPDEQYDTVLRVLDIENEHIKKQLIINHSIEQMLLIANVSDASKVMYDGTRLRHVRGCYSFHPHDKRKGILLRYTPGGEPSQDPVAEWGGAPRMKGDIEEIIRARAQAAEDAVKDWDAARATWQASRVEHGKAVNDLKRHDRRNEELKIASQGADDRVVEVQDAINEDRVESGRLEALNSALSNFVDEKALAEDQFKDAVNQEDTKKRARLAAQAEVDKINAEVQQYQARLDQAIRAQQKTDSSKQAAILERNACESDLQYGRTARDSVEQRRQGLANDVATNIAYLEEKVSKRVAVPDDESLESLQARYNRIEAEHKRAERSMGMTLEEATTAHRDTMNKFKQAKKDYDNLREVESMLKDSLRERKIRWEQFRRCIAARARITFSYLLSERGFRGQLLVDHRKRLLDINIEPDITKKSSAGRSTKTLSGGEKSFSQICLLLSMWEASTLR